MPARVRPDPPGSGSSDFAPAAACLDFRHFLARDTQESFCHDFVASLLQHGYVLLNHHPLAGGKVEQLFEMSAVGQENISAITDFVDGVMNTAYLKDVKETFDQGRDGDASSPNIWPKESDLPGFRAFMEDFFESAHDTLLQLLRALALGLELPKETFARHHGMKHHESRLLHYPSVPSHVLQGAENTRIASHTDFGSMSLLFQDSVGALEGESLEQKGHFYPIMTKAQDTMIVILGDGMQRWTNKTLHAIPHRVTSPASHDASSRNVTERYSAAFFGKPDRDVSLAPMQWFVSRGGHVHYDDMTAGQYGNSKLYRTY